MATSKPISTISYNSEPFLKETLQRWYDNHIIQGFTYILHKGEDGDKDHIHLRVEPNRVLDPMNLLSELQEPVKDSDKPLGCLKWRPSKEEDWFLYVTHDPVYLAQKYGEDKDGKIPYDWQNIVADPSADVQTVFLRAKASLKYSTSSAIQRLKAGESASNLVAEGQNASQVYTAVRILRDTDYYVLAKENADLQDQLDAASKRFVSFRNQLECELFNIGFRLIESEDGKIELVKREDKS